MAGGTDLFLLDKSHQRVIAGNRRALQKPNLSTIFVIAPILLIVGLYCIGTSVSVLLHGLILSNFGLDANGVITRLERYGSGGRGTTYAAFYSFSANDKHVYARQAAIGGNSYQTLKIGDAVNVKYMDGNPNDARLDVYDPEERNELGAGFVLGVPCFGVACAGFIAANLRLRRWHRLMVDGQLIEGRVVALKQKNYGTNRRRVNHLIVSYEFDSPSNRLIKANVTLDYELAHDVLAVGMTFAVLYVHDRLFQVL